MISIDIVGFKYTPYGDILRNGTYHGVMAWYDIANQYDSKAIAISILVGTVWYPIGYIPKSLNVYAHDDILKKLFDNNKKKVTIAGLTNRYVKLEISSEGING